MRAVCVQRAAPPTPSAPPGHACAAPVWRQRQMRASSSPGISSQMISRTMGLFPAFLTVCSSGCSGALTGRPPGPGRTLTGRSALEWSACGKWKGNVPRNWTGLQMPLPGFSRQQPGRFRMKGSVGPWSSYCISLAGGSTWPTHGMTWMKTVRRGDTILWTPASPGGQRRSGTMWRPQ